MWRYLRLYAHFLRFSFGRAMQFRLDFFFRVGMDSLWYVHYLVFYGVLYLHTDTLGGWGREVGTIFVGTLFVADALQMTLFSNNFWQLPIAVNKGELDYHLVRPVSTLFFVTLRDFAANSFLNLLIAVTILAWALASGPTSWPAGRLALFLALIPVGVFIHYGLQLLFLLPVFWLHSGAGLRDLFWSVDAYTARPVGIFSGWVRRLLTSLLPLCLVVSFPVRALVEADPWTPTLHMLAVAGGSFALVLLVWRRALRAYASASS